MRKTGTSPALTVLTIATLLACGGLLGVWHARAWGLGRGAPALGFDAAQYALAARTLATEGRPATTFALPIDLVRHATPPWPLSVVQPGMMVFEAAVERMVPHGAPFPGGGRWDSPAHREWLAIVLSFAAYLGLAVTIALGVRGALDTLDPDGPRLAHRIVGLTAGLSLLLDAEAQHLALGGFTELPYTLGVTLALAGLAAGTSVRRPFAWGLLLGLTTLVRGNLLMLIPILVVAAALQAARERRSRVVVLASLGWLLPLVPWWLYKWHAFGTPFWDLSALALWDGVRDLTWFSLTHRPEIPELPSGAALAPALFAKIATHLGRLIPAYAATLAGVATLVLGFALAAPSAPLEDMRVADPAAVRAARGVMLVALLHAALALMVAALGAGWQRYVFPARVPVEAAAFAAAWLGLARARRGILGGVPYGALALALLVFVLGFGIGQTVRGNAEARAAASERGLPLDATLERLARDLDPRPAGEVVMSNLGPTLAWFAQRPVLHLALTPADVAACRAQVPFHEIVLAFREPSRAWPAWEPLVVSNQAVRAHREWGLREIERRRTADGFTVVRLVVADAHGTSDEHTPAAADSTRGSRAGARQNPGTRRK